MNYIAARSLIRSGDLFAWGHEAWGSWYDLKAQGVRMFTRSEYAHAAVAWCVGERVLVIEAVVPLVRIFPLSKLLPCYWLMGEKRNEWTQESELTALSKVGEPYSKWEAIKSFIAKVTPGANGVWQCAELAAFIRAQMLLENYESPTPTSVVQAALAGGASLVMLTSEPRPVKPARAETDPTTPNVARTFHDVESSLRAIELNAWAAEEVRKMK